MTRKSLHATHTQLKHPPSTVSTAARRLLATLAFLSLALICWLKLAPATESQAATQVSDNSRPLVCVTPPANLVSWLRAEGNTTDVSGLNNGTLLNGATFGTGKVGQAFSLDGSNDYVRIGDSPTLRPTNVTLEAWVNFASLSGLRAIIAKTVGNGTFDSYAIAYTNGQLLAVVGDVSGEGTVVQAPFAPTLGTWYHIAYTFDDPSNSQVLYLNGVAVASGTTTKTIGYDNHPLLLGADTENGVEGAFSFSGSIDEATIYSRAL